MTVRAHFLEQAAACKRLGSPFTAAVLGHLAVRLTPTTDIGRALLAWPGDPGEDALALRLAGGLHALALSNAAPALTELYLADPGQASSRRLTEAIDAALAQHGDFLLGFVASPPQTNEVGRAAVLLGGFLAIAAATDRPLALLEIGASAGLNLHFDAYHHRLGDFSWGPAAAVQLAPDWQGERPPAASVEVISRRGCDRSPIDPASAEDRLRLRAYVWPDQPARRRRLEAALDHAAASTVRVETSDAADWLDARLDQVEDDVVPVVYHSIVWQYLPPPTQGQIVSRLAEAGGRPLGWLRMEPAPDGAHAELRLTLWPGGQERHLADAHFHGQWIRWRGA